MTNAATAFVRRLWWAVGWFGVGLVVYLSLMHNPPQLDVMQGDKLQHAAAYAALMLWFAHLSPRPSRRIIAATLIVGLGIGMEFAQGATDYRAFSYGDMLADAVGVGIGWALAPPRLPDFLALAQRFAARF